MSTINLKLFADEWLAAWSGNQPGILLSYYAENIFYVDPANPTGIIGKVPLENYLKKLLQNNPSWIWTREEIFPTTKGFTLKWKAKIPLHSESLILFGMDIVEIKNNKIFRNEVYFDRHEWLMKMGSAS